MMQDKTALAALVSIVTVVAGASFLAEGCKDHTVACGPCGSPVSITLLHSPTDIPAPRAAIQGTVCIEGRDCTPVTAIGESIMVGGSPAGLNGRHVTVTLERTTTSPDRSGEGVFTSFNGSPPCGCSGVFATVELR